MSCYVSLLYFPYLEINSKAKSSLPAIPAAQLADRQARTCELAIIVSISLSLKLLIRSESLYRRPICSNPP